MPQHRQKLIYHERNAWRKYKPFPLFTAYFRPEEREEHSCRPQEKWPAARIVQDRAYAVFKPCTSLLLPGNILAEAAEGMASLC